MAPKAQIQFTYEDYKSLPYSETKRYELIEGELIMVPSPDTEHQDIVGNLFRALSDHVTEHRLGKVYVAPLDVVLGDEEEVVQPDILYISHQRRGIITREEIRGAPDLVVEVLSPSTAQRDRTLKKKVYARHGVQEYWIVDPQAQTVEVYEWRPKGFERVGLYGAEQMLTSRILPTLRIPLREIF
ncbi:MAG: Uma2 family endonuclease [Nitrososphaerota archaeon]